MVHVSSIPWEHFIIGDFVYMCEDVFLHNCLCLMQSSIILAFFSMINIFSWAFTCSLVLLCTLDEDFWIQVLGFLFWVLHSVFILGFFPCLMICWSCFCWVFSSKDFGFDFSPCLFVYSGYFDFFCSQLDYY